MSMGSNNQRNNGGCSGVAIGCASLFAIAVLLPMLVNSPEFGFALLAALLIVGAALYYGHDHQRRREAYLLQRRREDAQRQMAEEERYYAQMERLAFPYIQRFVAARFPPRGPWPDRSCQLEAPDLAALGTLLERQQVRLTLPRLKRAVEIVIGGHQQRQFWTSFVKRNPWLPPCPSAEQWAEAYVATFEENLEYLPLVAVAARNRGATYAPEDLQLRVHEAIHRRTHERRVQELAQVVLHGKVPAAPRRTIAQVDRMSGTEFEQLLQQLFQAMGYQVRLTKGSGDQGADLILEKFGERTVVQAKRYSDRVSNSAIQEAVAAKALYCCHRAMVVTSNYFTRSAKDLASSNDVPLWDREKLAATLAQYL